MYFSLIIRIINDNAVPNFKYQWQNLNESLFKYRWSFLSTNFLVSCYFSKKFSTNLQKGYGYISTEYLTDIKSSYIKLPFKGEEIKKVMNSLCDAVMKHTSAKLSRKCHIKGKRKQQHKYDLAYNVRYPECNDDYVDEMVGNIKN